MRARLIATVIAALGMMWACSSDESSSGGGGDTGGTGGTGGSGGSGGTDTAGTGGNAGSAAGTSAGGTGGTEADASDEEDVMIMLTPECENICMRAMTGCDWDEATRDQCAIDCSSNSTDSECAAEVTAAVECGQDKPIVCQGGSQWIVDGCDDELMAVGECEEANSGDGG